MSFVTSSERNTEVDRGNMEVDVELIALEAARSHEHSDAPRTHTDKGTSVQFIVDDVLNGRTSINDYSYNAKDKVYVRKSVAPSERYTQNSEVVWSSRFSEGWVRATYADVLPGRPGETSMLTSETAIRLLEMSNQDAWCGVHSCIWYLVTTTCGFWGFIVFDMVRCLFTFSTLL